MHKTSMNAMKIFINKYLDKTKELTILDVGSLQCDESSETYKKLFDSNKWHYLGLDLVWGRNVDIKTEDPYNYPFKDNYFDVVVSGQALEHVARPWEWIREIYRILKYNGLFCVIVPSGGKRHFDKDYWRMMPDGLEELFNYAGFLKKEIIRNKKGKWKDVMGVGSKTMPAVSSSLSSGLDDFNLDDD